MSVTKTPKLAAALRTGTAGSQGESPCRAIHKLNGNSKSDVKGWRSEDRRYKFKGDDEKIATTEHSQEWLCHEDGVWR